ncbi:MAG: methionyl-tRNA formyltransferase [Microscillaceae bacterium]
MRIIFFGTPDFAVSSLAALIEHNFEVVAVVTAPDKPGGRGQQLLSSPVKEFAQKHQLPVLQPPNLKAPDFIDTLRGFHADLQIVVAFRMLPEVVWAMPPKGTFNLHASLLPQYRGAAPINWALINGETETGLTTFMLRHEIDTGHILFQVSEEIYPEDNFGTLYERLRHKGAKLVVRTVEAIIDDEYEAIAQDMGLEVKTAPKLSREIAQIDWQKPALQIHHLVRGLSPVPAAWTTWQGKICKIFRTRLPSSAEAEALTGLSPGQWHTDQKSLLLFQTGEGPIAIEELQLEGKKRLDIRAFLAGHRL